MSQRQVAAFGWLIFKLYQHRKSAEPVAYLTTRHMNQMSLTQSYRPIAYKPYVIDNVFSNAKPLHGTKAA